MTTAVRVLVSTHNSRARSYRLPATLTAEEWTRTCADFRGLCAYCQEAQAEAVDHFIPLCRGGGTTAGNCLPVCRACNLTKSARLPEDAFPAERVQFLLGYLKARSTGQNIGDPPRTIMAFRVDDDLARAIDKAGEQIQKQTPGLEISRSEVARILLRKALMGNKS